eukprot:7025358-Heterocapsa_arctica.AAC.1
MPSEDPPRHIVDEATAARALARPWTFSVDPGSGSLLPRAAGALARTSPERAALARRVDEVSHHARS